MAIATGGKAMDEYAVPAPECGSRAASDFSAIFGPEDPRAVSECSGDAKSRIQRLGKTKNHVDVEFKLSDGTSLMAHRLILSLRSPTFAAMFYDGFKEGQVPTSTKLQVKIDDVTAEAFRFVVGEIYGTRVPINDDNLLQFLAAANHYMVEEAAIACIEYLINTRLNPETACDILRLIPAWLKNRTRENEVLNHIARNFSTVASTTAFLYLDPARLHTILDSDKLEVKSEVEVFLALVRWAQFQGTLQHPEERTKPTKTSATTRIGYDVVKLSASDYYFEDDSRRIAKNLNLKKDMLSLPPPDAASITRADIVKALFSRREREELKESYDYSNVQFEETVVNAISHKLLHACRLGLLTMEELSQHVVPMNVLTPYETLSLYRQAARRHLRQSLPANASPQERQAARPRISVAGFSGFERTSEISNPETYVWSVVYGDDPKKAGASSEKADFVPTQLSMMAAKTDDGRTVCKVRRDMSSSDIVATTEKTLPVVGLAGYVYWQITYHTSQVFEERDLIGFQYQAIDEKSQVSPKNFGILVGSNTPSTRDSVLEMNLTEFPPTKWADGDRIGFLYEPQTGECHIFRNEEFLATLSTLPAAQKRQSSIVATATIRPYIVLTSNASYTLEVMNRPPASLNLP